MPKRKTRKDGRVRGKIYLGDGKYRYVYGRTDKEVKDKLAALRVELNAGVDLTQNRTLSFWIDRWLKREEQKQTPEWHATCRARAELWRDRLGREDITQLTSADLEDVLIELAKRNPTTGKPSSKKTLTEYRNVIARIFSFCRQNRVLTFDPTEYLAVEKNAARSRREPLTDAQISAIRETPHETRLACLIMIYANLRLGELAALTWSDVDLSPEAPQIRVNKSYNFKSGSVKPPKTAAGVRHVPIPPPLLAELRAAPRASLLVCPHNGRVYTRCAWEYALEQYSHALGFPLRAHNLRHTCCTLYYEAGIDVLTAQKWMGHADASTTMGIYTHLREQKQQSDAAKLAKYLGWGSDGGQNSPQSLENK